VEKPRRRWKDAVWRESSRVAPDTELEGGSSEDRRLEEGDLGGHGPTTGRSDTEESRRLSETMKYFISQHTRCPGEDSNRESPEERSRSLPVQQ